MRKTSAIKQIPMYIAKNYRLFMNQKEWKFIVIAGAIAFLVCVIVKDGMFENYDDTESGFFAIVSAAIWIGVFNSIQRICKEHDTITSEYRSGLHLSAYILSQVLFDFAVCFIQSIILTSVSIVFIDFPKDGLIFSSAWIEYFITLFLVVWGSDIMGIMVSSVASTSNIAMTTMPFILILQLVMGGVLFKLSGIPKMISNITFCKWGMSALGSISDLNSPTLPYKISAAYPEVVRLDGNSLYEASVENLLQTWGIISGISMSFILISFISLKIRNRGA